MKNKKLQSKSLTSQSDEKKYRCEKCQDREFILVVDDQGHEWAKECECRKFREHERRIANSHIASTFQEKGFGNFKEINKNYSQLKEFVMNFYKEKKIKTSSILFTGQVGSGKTHLAMALTNNLLKQGESVLYIDYRTFISKLKQSIVDREEYQKMMNDAKDANILYIDDLFKGKIRDADINAVFELVNNRYLAGKQMIITTELDVNALKDIDEAIASRIIEMTRGNIIKMPDKNYRLL